MHVDLFFRRLRQRGQELTTNHFSPIQIIVFYYILMTALSLVLSYLPIPHEPGNHVSFVDILFMAISAVSVTRLSTFDTNSVFNDNGIILLEVLFQVGGLGTMMISTAFAIFSKRQITLKQRQLIMADINQPCLPGIVRLIRITFAILIRFQLLLGAFSSVYLYYRGCFSRWCDAVFHGFHQAMSAVTDSEFGVTGNSIKPFAHDYFLLTLIIFSVFVGGVGFLVLMECRE